MEDWLKPGQVDDPERGMQLWANASGNPTAIKANSND